MKIDTQFIARCVRALSSAMDTLQQTAKEDIAYDVYRAAVVKEFEIVLEQSGKLLKKRLRPFFHSHKAVDELHFKNLFREAGKHGLLEIEEVERWLQYRNNRNATAHDYGLELAEAASPLMPQFIKDVKQFIKMIDDGNDH